MYVIYARARTRTHTHTYTMYTMYKHVNTRYAYAMPAPTRDLSLKKNRLLQIYNNDISSLVIQEILVFIATLD
jgi:hypothetical protein